MSKLTEFFDNITPDEDTKDRILKNIMEKSAGNRKNKVIYLRKIAPYAAAVIVFSFIAANHTNLKQYIMPNTYPAENTAESVTPQDGIKDFDSEKQQDSKTDTEESGDSGNDSKSGNINKKTDNQGKNQSNNEYKRSVLPASGSENNAEYTENEKQEDTILYSDDTANNVNENNELLPAVMSGRNMEGEHSKEISFDDIREYSFCVPKDIFSEKYFAQGEKTGERIYFVFEKDDASLGITVLPGDIYSGNFDSIDELANQESFTLLINGYAVTYNISGNLNAREIISEIN